MTFKPLTALVILLSAALGIIGYMVMGEPGMGDLPMDKRQGAIMQKVALAPETLTPAETLTILEARVVEAPEDPEPHFFIGEMLRAEGRPSDAARAYQSALRRDADFVPGLIALANTMVAMNDGGIGPEATRLFARAYELDETQVQAGMRAAMGAAQAGNQDVAEKAMRYIYNRLPEGDPRRERFRPMIEAIGQVGDDAAPESTASEDRLREVDDRLSWGGFESREEAQQFIAKVQDILARDDREAFVDLVFLPFERNIEGEVIARYETRVQLLEDFDSIVTDRIRAGVAKSTYEDLILNWRGGAICNGCIWFNRFDGEIKIIRISG